MSEPVAGTGSKGPLPVAPAPATTAPGPSGAAVQVPSWLGLDVAEARASAEGRGFRVVLSDERSAPAGEVVSQTPRPGSMLAQGATVTMTVGRAPTLGRVLLMQPSSGTAVPKNFGVTFLWSPVPEAEDYQFQIFVWKDDTWVVADNDIVRGVD